MLLPVHAQIVVAPLSISSFGLITLPLVTQLQHPTFYSLNYGQLGVPLNHVHIVHNLLQESKLQGKHYVGSLAHHNLTFQFLTSFLICLMCVQVMLHK